MVIISQLNVSAVAVMSQSNSLDEISQLYPSSFHLLPYHVVALGGRLLSGLLPFNP